MGGRKWAILVRFGKCLTEKVTEEVFVAFM